MRKQVFCDSKGFTLIELLLVIAIIAILAAAAFWLIDPAEQYSRSRDADRVSDLKALNEAIEMALYTSSSADATEDQVVYVSLPDTNGNISDDCKASGEHPSLPDLPAGWSYRCHAVATDLHKADGTGWIPFALSGIEGATLNALPIDPDNSEDHYYAFAHGSDATEYSLFTPMESEKFASLETDDGGVRPEYYETAPLSFITGNTWVKIGGDLIWGDVAAASDGGSIVVGSTGGAVAYAKVNVSGVMSWRKKMDMVENDEFAAVAPLPDGNFIIAGSTENFGNGYANTSDALLMKIDPAGNVLWAKTVGTSNNAEIFYSIYPTSDTGFIATGEVWGASTVMADTFIAKFAADGSLSWARRLSGPTHDYGNSVIEADGKYIVAGTDTYDCLVLAQFDQSGNMEWVKGFGTTITNSIEGNAVVEAADGNYVVAGAIEDGGSYDLFAGKFRASDGAALWGRKFEDGDDDYSVADAIVKDGNEYVLAGRIYAAPFITGQDGVLLKIDDSGALLWTKIIGEEDVDVGDTIWGLTKTTGSYTVFGYDDNSVDSTMMKLDLSWNIDNCPILRAANPTPVNLSIVDAGIPFNVFSFSPPVISFSPAMMDEPATLSSACPV